MAAAAAAAATMSVKWRQAEELEKSMSFSGERKNICCFLSFPEGGEGEEELFRWVEVGVMDGLEYSGRPWVVSGGLGIGLMVRS